MIDKRLRTPAGVPWFYVPDLNRWHTSYADMDPGGWARPASVSDWLSVAWDLAGILVALLFLLFLAALGVSGAIGTVVSLTSNHFADALVCLGLFAGVVALFVTGFKKRAGR
jgi:hypothetical protein